MNTITDVKPGLAKAYRDKSSHLYVRERRDSAGRYSYKVSTVKSLWSSVKQFFRSLFTCCTRTNYSYGLNAYQIISANPDLEKRVSPLPMSTLMETKAIESLVFNGLVPDVYPRIFSHLDFRALQASCCVSKACHRLAFEQNQPTRQKVDGIAFGSAEWKALGLDIGKEPLILPSLVKSLDKPDPVDPSRAIGDTHMLVWVPAGLTLKSLGALVKSRFPGSDASGYRYIWDRTLNQLSVPNEKSYWVLMTKDIIPESRNQSFETQEEMVAIFAENANAEYVIPTVLEAAVCILTHEFKLGERLFGENPWTFTHCQDKVDGSQIYVGGFSPIGLGVLSSHLNSYEYGPGFPSIGVAVLRKS